VEVPCTSPLSSMSAFRIYLVQGLPSTTVPTATYAAKHDEDARYHMEKLVVGERKSGHKLKLDALRFTTYLKMQPAASF
jgi:hypothetical protein